MEEPTWGAVCAWIHARHAVVAETDTEIAFTFDIDGLPCRVVVSLASCDDATWILISSPVARAVHAHLTDALRLVSRSVIGTLAIIDERLVIRHAEPMVRVTADSLEEHCREVAISAVHVSGLARVSPSKAIFQHFAD